MSVRAKTLLILGLGLPLLALLLWGVARVVLLRGFASIEEADARRNVERAVLALRENIATLDRSARDYAAWDETYALVERGDPEWFARNFAPDTVTNLHLDALVLWRRDGSMLMNRGFDPATGEDAPPVAELAALPPDDPLRLLDSTDAAASGALRIGDRILLVASRPILTSAYAGPVHAVLVMGRWLDDEELARLAASTRLSLAIRAPGDPGDAELARVASDLAGPSSSALLRTGPDSLVGFAEVPDPAGRPALVLRVSMDRAIYRQGLASLRALAVAQLIAGGGVGLLMLLLLERTLLARLARLGRDIQQVGEHHSLTERIPVSGSDEIGVLAGKINAMLDELGLLSRDLESEQARSQSLLLNVLPGTVVERLKAGEGTIADRCVEGTVLFADLVDFTEVSARISPEEVVALLNEVFSAFDRLTEKHGLEKIKTIGDAYMVVGGLPVPQADHAERVAEMALDIVEVLGELPAAKAMNLRIRIGINSGPIIAGVVGRKKFLYDLWGDTVNVASRMESHGLAGAIQVTTATYERLRGRFRLEERGVVLVKGKGEMVTWILRGKLPGNDRSGTPVGDGPSGRDGAAPATSEA